MNLTDHERRILDGEEGEIKALAIVIPRQTG